MLAARESSAATVAYHTAAAASAGLSMTEEKALDLLERAGPLTARELSERSGLAPASVTGLVDRLERKGFARRVRHPSDGRRVVVELHPARAAHLVPVFARLLSAMEELYSGYTDAELAMIADYLRQAASRLDTAALALDPDGAARWAAP